MGRIRSIHAIGGCAGIAILGCVLGAIGLAVRDRFVGYDLRVQRVNKPDSRLQLAIAEARKRLPEFDKYLASAKVGDRFAICGKFESEVGPEYLWVHDVIRTPDGYMGLLDQVPIAVKIKKGDLVPVDRADVVDWMVRRDERVEGGFTNEVLASRR